MNIFKLVLASLSLVFISTTAQAEVDKEVAYIFNSFSFLVHGFLVMLMAAGFCMLETGLVRAKNAVVQCAKNIGLYSIAGLMFAFVGYNLMYDGVIENTGWIGSLNIWGPGEVSVEDGYSAGSDWFFQMVFCATAASIVSGAVAERDKLSSFLIFVVVLTGFIYPIQGSWSWGTGFLNGAGFLDFAGSSIVHGVGGWAALTGCLILGARQGKYAEDGSVRPMPGSNLPLATLGTFLLWFGWYGFNGGSVLSADPGLVSLVFVTTTLAAAAGVIGAMLTSWGISRKPDLSMILNGSLAGLVGITAGADVISPMNAVIVGLLAGAIVVVSVMQLDKMKIDDPVGAISVHLVCGIWGTLAVGIFSPDHSVVTQAIGVVAYGIFCLICATIIFKAVTIFMGLRVSEEEEIIGLDIGEHDMESYAGFQIFSVE